MPDTPSFPNPKLTPALQRQWTMTAGVFLIALAGMFVLLLQQWQAAQLLGWLLIAGLALFYELRIFKQALPYVPLDGDGGMGRGVMAVLAAGLGYGLLAGMLMLPQMEGWWGWIPGGLALAAMIAEELAATWFRHGISRGARHVRREFRALGLLVVTAMAVHYNRFDPWFLAIGLMDYLLLFTASWRARKGREIPAITPSQPRSWLQMLYLVTAGVALLPFSTREVMLVLGVLYGVPYFLLALRDWFILAGLLHPDQGIYSQVSAAVRRAIDGWLALTVRLFAGVLSATLLADMLFHFDVYVARFGAAWKPGALALLLLVTLPFLFLGIRVRWAALAALVAFAGVIIIMGWNPVVFAGLFLTGASLLLGQGRVALESSDV